MKPADLTTLVDDGLGNTASTESLGDDGGFDAVLDVRRNSEFRAGRSDLAVLAGGPDSWAQATGTELATGS